jgi:hypothetical protein
MSIEAGGSKQPGRRSHIEEGSLPEHSLEKEWIDCHHDSAEIGIESQTCTVEQPVEGEFILSDTSNENSVRNSSKRQWLGTEKPGAATPYIAEALNKLENTQTAALKLKNETEIDVWCKSLAIQLNGMELSRALDLQLQIQTLLSRERIAYESRKIQPQSYVPANPSSTYLTHWQRQQFLHQHSSSASQPPLPHPPTLPTTAKLTVPTDLPLPTSESGKSIVTVDAVHPRLLDKSKQPQKYNCTLVSSNKVAYCLQCEESIGCTVTALRNHFGSTLHESQPCVYCHGPVYNCIFRSEKYYHECIRKATHGEEASDRDTSDLSEHEGSDVSEKQSISTEDAETTSLFHAPNTDSRSVSDMPSDEGA